MQFLPEFDVVRVVGIDGVIFRQRESVKIVDPEPLPGSIEIINDWYDGGDYVMIWSARHPSYEALTRKQLDSVGLKYHELRLGKPLAGLMVIYDDREICVVRVPKNIGLEKCLVQENQDRDEWI